MKKDARRHPTVAIVYDRVNTPFGGAEHVLIALHTIFPEAPLFTSVYDPQRASWADIFQVRPSFLERVPGATTFHRHAVGLMPLAFESFNLDDFDIIISVTSAEAKGIVTKAHQLHICYLLTPTRYLWSHPDEYRQPWLIEQIKKPIFTYLRWWDRAAAQRPDVIIPISQRVAERCKTFYGRQAGEVIYPPVELLPNREDPEPLPEILRQKNIRPNEYYLIVARLVSYKKVDLAIRACAALGKPLVIIGDGPELARLARLQQKLAHTTSLISIKSVLSSQLAAYYKNCCAFLAPGEEDFGIAALEANSFGKPCILHPNSGVAEVSPDGVASIHLQLDTKTANTNFVIELQRAIVASEAQTWDAQRIRLLAAKYSTEQFQERFHQRVMKEWKEFYAR